LLSFSNSVCRQGRVIPPSVLKFKSVGWGPGEVLHQGCRESPGPATNLANWTKINGLNAVQGFMTTKWRIINGVGQGSHKSGVRRLRLVRLCAAGKYRKGAVSGARVGSHSTVMRRTTNGTVRCSSSSRCTVRSACTAAVASSGDLEIAARATSWTEHSAQGHCAHRSAGMVT
jgi:hypothetical protein